MANIKIITGATGDKNVNAEDDRANNYGLYGYSGIIGTNGYTIGSDNYFHPEGTLNATLKNSTTVHITRGDFVLQGCHARIPLGQSLDLAIAPGTAGYYRLDCIIAHYRKNKLGVESVAIEVVKGTPRASKIDLTTANKIIAAQNKGNISQGDTDVREVMWTVYLEGTTTNVPKRNMSLIVPIGLLQNFAERLNQNTNGMYDILIDIGTDMTTAFNDLNAINPQETGASITKLKSATINMVTSLIQLKKAVDYKQNIHLIRPVDPV